MPDFLSFDVSLTHWQTVALVLLSAVLHATWNAVIKGSDDKSESFLMVCGYPGLLFIFLIPWLPMPSADVWTFIILSNLAHVVYYITLTNAYRVGDFGYVYPIARGLSPLVVTIYAFLVLAENLPITAVVGILAIALGIMANVFERGYRNINMDALKWSLACGLSIGFYSVVDGLGARAAEHPFFYVIYLFIGEFLIFWTWAGIKYGRGFYAKAFSQTSYIFGGFAALMSYGTVLFAITHSQMGVVTALRETSTVFATLIAWFIFKESLSRRRIINACIVCVGVILIVIA